MERLAKVVVQEWDELINARIADLDERIGNDYPDPVLKAELDRAIDKSHQILRIRKRLLERQNERATEIEDYDQDGEHADEWESADEHLVIEGDFDE